MKRKLKLTGIILALALILTACAGSLIPAPDTMADGTPWDSSWVNMAGKLGVAQPGEPFSLLTTNGTLDGLDIRCATWVCGAETEIEKDAYVYEGQIYLMTEQCTTAEEAAKTSLEWEESLAALTVTERRTVTVNGAEYELTCYDCAPDSHFSRGVCARWTWGDMVLVVDIACVQGLDLDLTGLMEQFIAGIHYA